MARCIYVYIFYLFLCAMYVDATYIYYESVWVILSVLSMSREVAHRDLIIYKQVDSVDMLLNKTQPAQ